MRAVRRVLGLALGSMAVWAAPAHACAITGTLVGAAPLRTTLATDCAGADVRWDFGDGQVATGAQVEHVFGTGAWRVSLAVDGVPAATAGVTSYAVSMRGPRSAAYGDRIVLRGTVVPALSGPIVVNGKKGLRATRGSFRIAVRHRRPSYDVRFLDARAQAVVRVRPQLEVRLVGSTARGSSLRLAARLRPSNAGAVFVESRSFTRGFGSVAIDTSRERTLSVRVRSVPAAGFAAVRRTVSVTIATPSLQLGSRGPSVLELERMLAEQRYALQRVDATYGFDTYEAVLAFQKVHGLARTGRVDAALWHRIEHAQAPAARYPGDHVEVDKARQVLFVVRGGEVELVVHVSTGATGNTPLGVWHVYRKVTGWSWVLWYPSFFLRGFAIHGYPEVPAYPASHGCVRVPMWIAPRLYAEIPSGGAVYVYV